MTRRTTITGGAGFIGTNLAARLLAEGGEVVVVDDLSRPGVERNLRWLEGLGGGRLVAEVGDIRDAGLLRRSLDGADQVFHLAAQVAVTTSLDAPVHDFGVNLGGTVTLLEELRRLADPPPLLFTSTNKVYGHLDGVTTERRGRRHEPTDRHHRQRGVSEDRPLQFCSPYGCSKGGADQYVLDYARSYGLPATVFRMSCIYGPHQCGTEDQGWVAHFLLQAMAGKPITIYGDGGQVRDVLFVDDLVEAMLAATADIERTRGHAFNMGGGPERTTSLLELLDHIASLVGRRPEVDHGPWRVGDQRWYVSDTSRFTRATGWQARVPVDEGVARLHGWLAGERALTGVES